MPPEPQNRQLVRKSPPPQNDRYRSNAIFKDSAEEVQKRVPDGGCLEEGEGRGVVRGVEKREVIRGSGRGAFDVKILYAS